MKFQRGSRNWPDVLLISLEALVLGAVAWWSDCSIPEWAISCNICDNRVKELVWNWIRNGKPVLERERERDLFSKSIPRTKLEMQRRRIHLRDTFSLFRAFISPSLSSWGSCGKGNAEFKRSLEGRGHENRQNRLFFF